MTKRFSFAMSRFRALIHLSSSRQQRIEKGAVLEFGFLPRKITNPSSRLTAPIRRTRSVFAT